MREIIRDILTKNCVDQSINKEILNIYDVIIQQNYFYFPKILHEYAIGWVKTEYFNDCFHQFNFKLILIFVTLICNFNLDIKLYVGPGVA